MRIAAGTGLRDHRLWLLVLAAALLLVVLGRPILPLALAGYRYVFVLDITQSMNVPDSGSAGDRSRLDAAGQAVSKTLEAMAQSCVNEAGLALFTANRALLLFEPVAVCRNLHELQQVLNTVDPRLAWESSSEVAKALYTALVVTRDLPAHSRLVFITDGHEAPPINFDLRPPFNKGKPGEVAGLIVGVGGDLPAPIPKLNEAGEIDGFWSAEEVQQVDSFSLGRPRAGGGARDALVGAGISNSELQQRISSGSEHLSALREDYLRRLAEETQLAYYRLEDPDDLPSRLLDGEFADYSREPRDARWLFGTAALVLLLALLLPDPPWRYTGGRIPRPAR